ncbi:MAG: fumarylacetoacetase [Myxococcota bacterium]
MPPLNETHDPNLKSWVATANADAADFTIQNLPFASFRRVGTNEPFRGGVAIGDQIVDLAAAHAAGIFSGLAADAADAAAKPALNDFMAMGAGAWAALRLALSRGLREGSAQQDALQATLVPQDDAEYAVPAQIGDYTDFYTSIHHATNIGSLFRPNNPILPNYKWIPIGYHGRSSSIRISGVDVIRPNGQTRPAEGQAPGFGPSRRLDYELELGLFVGPGNALGDTISIDEAEAHIFGVVLLNDWSARDIQGWEYQPLGPFLGKSFSTTISPWIVTLEALAPFRAPFTRPEDDPQPLAYLTSQDNHDRGHLDIQLEVFILTQKQRQEGTPPQRLSHSNYKDAYWTAAQLVTHHTVNGCDLRPGDLLGTGTLSGPDEGQQAALIEITRSGRQPLTLDNGEVRSFLEDGDAIILRGHCARDGAARVGFGEVKNTVAPAKS